MNIEQLIEFYRQGKRDFVWADLEGACLQGLQLAEANFNRAKFSSANLREADLRRVNFFKADLSYADLSGAQLDGASFRKTNLTGAKIELSQLPCMALRGAILPDGSLMTLEEEQPAEDLAVTSLSETAGTAALDEAIGQGTVVEPTAAVSVPEPSAARAQGLALYGVTEPEPIPAPVPPPQTWAEVWQVLPQKPLSLLILGYLIDGLTLYFSGAGGTAWVVSAIATLLWAMHESLSWFIPIVIGFVALYGGPTVNVVYLIISGAVMLSLLGAFKVIGWTWRKALYGALWIGGISAVVMGLTPWIIMPVGMNWGVFVPTTVLAAMLVLAMGLIGLGLTSQGAMSVARLNKTQQMGVMVASGVVGLVLGRLLGSMFG